MGTDPQLDNFGKRVSHNRNIMAFSLNQYYTIKASMLQGHGNGHNYVLDKKLNLNIYLDAESLLSAGLLARIISIENKCIYSLPSSMLSDNVSLGKYLPPLYLLLSCSAWLKAKEKIMPVISDDRNSSGPIDTTVLTTFFYDQGIEKIAFPFFEADANNSRQTADACTYIFCSTGFEKNLTTIFSINDPQNNADIFTPTIISFEEKMTGMKKFGELTGKIILFQKNQMEPAVWRALLECYEESRFLKVELGLWEKRALLYHDFLTLSKSVQEREYFDVLNWYHAEYESLPLWYKRVGHIIKVLKGKRTFRSLFSDNVKKHKN